MYLVVSNILMTDATLTTIAIILQLNHGNSSLVKSNINLTV